MEFKDYLHIDFNKEAYLSILGMFSVFFIALLFQIIKGKGKLGIVILSFFVVCSFFSLVFYNSSWLIYIEFKNINYKPIIFVTLLLLVLTVPFWSFKESQIKNIDISGSENFIRIISLFVGIISIPIFISCVKDLMSFNIGSFAAAYSGELKGGNPIYNILVNTLWKFKYFLAPLFFINISLWKHRKVEAFLCFVAISAVLLLSLTSGGRGTLLNFISIVFVSFAIQKNSLNDRLKNTLNKLARITGILIFSGIAIITVSRFGLGENKDLDKLVAWVSLYPGEGPLRFSEYMWDSNIRTEGDNSFSYVKDKLGYKTQTSNDDRREYWSKYQKIPNFIFYTSIGDIYSDLDTFFTIFFILVVTLIFSRILKVKKNESLAFHNLVLIELYFQFVLFGMMNYCYKSYLSQYLVFFTLLVLIVMQVLRKIKID